MNDKLGKSTIKFTDNGLTDVSRVVYENFKLLCTVIAGAYGNILNSLNKNQIENNTGNENRGIVSLKVHLLAETVVMHGQIY